MPTMPITLISQTLNIDDNLEILILQINLKN